MKVNKIFCFVVIHLEVPSYSRNVHKRCLAVLPKMRSTALKNSIKSFLVNLLWLAAATSSDLLGAVVVEAACFGYYWMIAVSPA